MTPMLRTAQGRQIRTPFVVAFVLLLGAAAVVVLLLRWQVDVDARPNEADRFQALVAADVRVRNDLHVAGIEVLQRDYSVTCEQIHDNGGDPGSVGSSVSFEIESSGEETLNAFEAQGHEFEPGGRSPSIPTQGVWSIGGVQVEIGIHDRDTHTVVMLGLGTSQCLWEDGGVYPP